MIRMFAKRLAMHRMTPGTDKVIVAWPIPSGSRLHDIRVRLSMSGDAFIGTQQIATYATEMWLLPVFDPEAAESIDTLWDQLGRSLLPWGLCTGLYDP